MKMLLLLLIGLALCGCSLQRYEVKTVWNPELENGWYAFVAPCCDPDKYGGVNNGKCMLQTVEQPAVLPKCIEENVWLNLAAVTITPVSPSGL
jgi:hypothetical protein